MAIGTLSLSSLAKYTPSQPPTLQPCTCEFVCSRRTTLHKWRWHSKHLLHCIMDLAVGFCTWILKISTVDWYACCMLVHSRRLSTLFGNSYAEVSFFPSTAAKSLLNKKQDGIKVSYFALWRKFLLLALVCWTFNVWGAFWIIMHCALNNIIIQGQSLQAVDNGCYFLSLFTVVLVIHWFYASYISSFIILF